MYWELKYQQGELRVQVQRGIRPTPPAGEMQPPPAPPGDSFVPLASLKR